VVDDGSVERSGSVNDGLVEGPGVLTGGVVGVRVYLVMAIPRGAAVHDAGAIAPGRSGIRLGLMAGNWS